MTALILLTGGCLPQNDLSKQPSTTQSEATDQLSAPLGTSSEALVGGTRFDSLVVEFQPIGRAIPSQEAFNHVRAFLLETLNIAPEKLQLVLNPSVESSSAPQRRPIQTIDERDEEPALTLGEIRSLERRLRRNRPILNRGAIFVLISNSRSIDDTATSRTFALAHQNTSIVLHYPAIRDVSGGTGQIPRWKFEAAVIEHEMGHVLGLVNTNNASTPGGATAVHSNESDHSPTHCRTEGCLMHESTPQALQLALASEADGIPKLCDFCKEALRTIRAQGQSHSEGVE